MFDAAPSSWPPVVWALYALAALYLVGFLVFYVRFERWERKAKREGGDAVARYNAMLRGFPNAVYAKQFGKRAFEVPATEPEPPRQP